MRTNNFIKAALVALVAVVAYLAGYTASSISNRQHYEAACFYADVVHCAMDADSTTATEMMEIYSSFVEGIDSCNFKALKPEHLKEYYWCY